MKEFKNYCKHGFAYNTYVIGNDKLFPNSKDEINNKDIIPNYNITVSGSEGVSLDVTEIEKGKPIEIKLNVKPNYYIETILIMMGDVDITNTVWDQLLEKITINLVTDNISISVTTSSTLQDRGYFEPVRIMNNNGVMSTGRLYFAVNTSVGSGSTVLCKPVLPNWLSYSSEYIGGNAGAFVQDYFYTTTASTTKYGYRKVSCSETIPIGKYKLPFSWQTESSSTWYLSNSMIEVVPYERKMLNGTDDEEVYDEFDLDSRDVTLNKTFIANKWTSICLPFDVSESKLKLAFGNDVLVAYLDEESTTTTNYSITDGKVYLVSDYPPEITKDTPCFIKSSKDLSSVNFDDVIIDPGETTDVRIGRGSRSISVFTGVYVLLFEPDEEYQFLILKNEQIIRSNTVDAYDVIFNNSIDKIYIDNELIIENNL